MSKIAQSVVTDRLNIEEKDVEKLLEKLDLSGSQWDRRLYYEVTGHKLEGDDAGIGSSDDESVMHKPESSSSSSDTESDLSKPLDQKGEEAQRPKSTANTKRTSKVDIFSFKETMIS